MTPAKVFRWVADRPSKQVERAIERIASAEDVARVAVMPDVHLASEVCVGVVVATSHLIYPAAVGGDIGCGMLAAAFDGDRSVLRDESTAHRLLRELSRGIPAIRHPKERHAPVMPDALRASELAHPALDAIRKRDGEVEFATLGRGNHFLEFQADEHERLWIAIHSGSRAIGPAVRDNHLRNARATSSGLFALDADDESGRAYLHDMQFARLYAAENRRAMLSAVAEIMDRNLGATLDESTCFECDHNHVARERHDGQMFWVHRKGACRAQDGDPAIIPGSMGTISFHTIGRGELRSLCSSSHGAGRAMSRSEARARIKVRDLQRQMKGVWFSSRDVDALRDEAPTAYKDIRKVMRAQRDLTRIIRTLRPLLVYKGT